MHPYFKLPELVTLAEGFLKFIRDPKQKDYDHVILSLDAVIKRVGQIMAVYPNPNDNFFPSVSAEYRPSSHKILEIIDISNQQELIMLKSSLGDLA